MATRPAAPTLSRRFARLTQQLAESQGGPFPYNVGVTRERRPALAEAENATPRRGPGAAATGSRRKDQEVEDIPWQDVEATVPQEVWTHLGQLLDATSQAREVAVQVGNAEVANGLEKLGRDAAGEVTQTQLIDRFGDYSDALMGLESARTCLADAASELTRDPDEKGEGVLDRLKAMLGAAKDAVVETFRRALRYADARLRPFVTSLENLLSSVATKTKSALVSGFREVFRILGSLAARVLSSLLSWAAEVRRIAKDRGFTLSKLTVRIPSSSWHNVSVLGFSVPIPTISSPEVEVEFT